MNLADGVNNKQQTDIPSITFCIHIFFIRFSSFFFSCHSHTTLTLSITDSWNVSERRIICTSQEHQRYYERSYFVEPEKMTSQLHFLSVNTSNTYFNPPASNTHSNSHHHFAQKKCGRILEPENASIAHTRILIKAKKKWTKIRIFVCLC